MVMFLSLLSVCLSVCLSVILLTFEILDLQVRQNI